MSENNAVLAAVKVAAVADVFQPQVDVFDAIASEDYSYALWFTETGVYVFHTRTDADEINEDEADMFFCPGLVKEHVYSYIHLLDCANPVHDKIASYGTDDELISLVASALIARNNRRLFTKGAA